MSLFSPLLAFNIFRDPDTVCEKGEEIPGGKNYRNTRVSTPARGPRFYVYLRWVEQFINASHIPTRNVVCEFYVSPRRLFNVRSRIIVTVQIILIKKENIRYLMSSMFRF